MVDDRPIPLAYFLTFRTDGTWLPGDERTWVSDEQNQFGSDFLPPSPSLHTRSQSLMTDSPFELCREARQVVDQAIREVARHRGWRIFELNVRTNHVHIVLKVAGPPEPVMNSCKAWATRHLTEAALVQRGAKIWARHGSTRYLWNQEGLTGAITYVRELQ